MYTYEYDNDETPDGTYIYWFNILDENRESIARTFTEDNAKMIVSVLNESAAKYFKDGKS